MHHRDIIFNANKSAYKAKMTASTRPINLSGAIIIFMNGVCFRNIAYSKFVFLMTEHTHLAWPPSENEIQLSVMLEMQIIYHLA